MAETLAEKLERIGAYAPAAPPKTGASRPVFEFRLVGRPTEPLTFLGAVGAGPSDALESLHAVYGQRLLFVKTVAFA